MNPLPNQRHHRFGGAHQSRGGHFGGCCGSIRSLRAAPSPAPVTSLTNYQIAYADAPIGLTVGRAAGSISFVRTSRRTGVVLSSLHPDVHADRRRHRIDDQLHTRQTARSRRARVSFVGSRDVHPDCRPCPGNQLSAQQRRLHRHSLSSTRYRRSRASFPVHRPWRSDLPGHRRGHGLRTRRRSHDLRHRCHGELDDLRRLEPPHRDAHRYRPARR